MDLLYGYAVRHHTVSLGAKYFPDLLEIRKVALILDRQKAGDPYAQLSQNTCTPVAHRVRMSTPDAPKRCVTAQRQFPKRDLRN
jgi:hypothetical protein